MRDPLVERYVLEKLRENETLMTRYTEREGRKLDYRNLFLRLKEHVENHLHAPTPPTQRLIVMPGLRGVGKTTLLWQVYRYLREKGVPPTSLFYLPVDEMRAFLGRSIAEVLQTYAEIVHRTTLAEIENRIFLFVDEAHFDPNWALTLKAVYDKNPNIFILATGSAALALTMDTDISRRALVEHVFPLSFGEYLMMKYQKFPPLSTTDMVHDVILNGPSRVDELAKVAVTLQTTIPSLILKFEDFVYEGGLAFCVTEKDSSTILDKCADIINRILTNDLSIIQNLTRETSVAASRILQFIALQIPGAFSQPKLANELKISPTTVNYLLDALQKSEVIFPVLPYAGAKRTVAKPWKYYFMTPTLMASLLHKLGFLDKSDKQRFGILVEHLVASYLYRMKQTTNRPQGIFYDVQEGGADFLIQDRGRTIPIEVTVSSSESIDQVKRSMRKYKSPYGIVLSYRGNFFVEEGVINMPLWVFAFA
jgi:predicted AAA+ superfamily ATPase